LNTNVAGRSAVVTCSALARAHRQLIADGHASVVFAQLLLDPATLHALLRETGAAVQLSLATTSQPVLLCSHAIRPQLRRLIEKSLPHVVVLSYREVAAADAVRSVATVKVPDAN
jgi:flagellar biosynthesis component FlhA